jgi:mannose-6-phosphate isomerase-like protein (cupin superfamily)
MMLDGETFEVGAGDVIRNVPRGTHGLANAGNEPLRMVVLDVASAQTQ